MPKCGRLSQTAVRCRANWAAARCSWPCAVPITTRTDSSPRCRRVVCVRSSSNGMSSAPPIAASCVWTTPSMPCNALRRTTVRNSGYGRRHHRFERQDRHQGVDRRRTARGDEILPLSEKLQFAAGRAPLGADARRRRGVSHLRGGHFEARRDGAAGAHHPSRRGCFYLDRRRAPGEFPQSRAEVRREDGAGPQCFENRLPQLL